MTLPAATVAKLQSAREAYLAAEAALSQRELDYEARLAWNQLAQFADQFNQVAQAAGLPFIGDPLYWPKPTTPVREATLERLRELHNVYMDAAAESASSRCLWGLAEAGRILIEMHNRLTIDSTDGHQIAVDDVAWIAEALAEFRSQNPACPRTEIVLHPAYRPLREVLASFPEMKRPTLLFKESMASSAGWKQINLTPDS